MANIFVGSVHTLIRNLFLGLDGIVYGFINHVYWLFSMLTEVSIFSQDQIEAFAGRIYVLISIIMLFKLGFSFITYIVNPDSFTDKQKGGTALLKNIAIAIILLASVPTIFNEAMHLQQLIFKNNVIDKILLGNTVQVEDSYVNENGENVQVEQSNALSMYAFMAFFQPNYLISECNTYEGIAISDSCVSKLNELDKTKHNPGSAYKQAIETYNLDFITATDIANTKGKVSTSNSDAFYVSDESYLFEYKYGLSTLVGVFIVWILLGFCLDLAIRVVKLGFLQIIAPIPIILSITPGQKNNPLSNWGKECFSTWLSLFTRVLVISFALTTIQLINSGGGIISFVTGGSNNYAMVTVFVMLGILLFAKEFPKLLEDILGLKGTGKMTFNPLKKISETPIVGKPFNNAVRTPLGWADANLHKGIDTLKNNALRLGGRINPFANPDNVEQKVKQRTAARDQAYWNRYDAAAWATGKKYDGQTESSIMRKQNFDTKKSMAEQIGKNKLEDTLSTRGSDAIKVLNSEGGANKIVDKIARGEEIEASERARIYSDYTKAYGEKHKDYARNEANLAIAKGKQEYLKNTVSELERLAAANPENHDITTQLNTSVKALASVEKQISGLEDAAKNLAKVDSGAADIALGIKIAKSKGKDTDVGFENNLDEKSMKKFRDSLSNQPAGSIANALNGNESKYKKVDSSNSAFATMSDSEFSRQQKSFDDKFSIVEDSNGIHAVPKNSGVNNSPTPQSTPSPQQPQRQNPGTVSSRGFGPGNNNQ